MIDKETLLNKIKNHDLIGRQALVLGDTFFFLLNHEFFSAEFILKLFGLTPEQADENPIQLNIHCERGNIENTLEIIQSCCDPVSAITIAPLLYELYFSNSFTFHNHTHPFYEELIVKAIQNTQIVNLASEIGKTLKDAPARKKLFSVSLFLFGRDLKDSFLNSKIYREHTFVEYTVELIYLLHQKSTAFNQKLLLQLFDKLNEELLDKTEKNDHFITLLRVLGVLRHLGFIEDIDIANFSLEELYRICLSRVLEVSEEKIIESELSDPGFKLVFSTILAVDGAYQDIEEDEETVNKHRNLFKVLITEGREGYKRLRYEECFSEKTGLPVSCTPEQKLFWVDNHQKTIQIGGKEHLISFTDQPLPLLTWGTRLKHCLKMVDTEDKLLAHLLHGQHKLIMIEAANQKNAIVCGVSAYLLQDRARHPMIVLDRMIYRDSTYNKEEVESAVKTFCVEMAKKMAYRVIIGAHESNHTNPSPFLYLRPDNLDPHTIYLALRMFNHGFSFQNGEFCLRDGEYIELYSPQNNLHFMYDVGSNETPEEEVLLESSNRLR